MAFRGRLLGTDWDASKWWVSQSEKLIGYLRWVISFWISVVKQYEETMANGKVKMGEWGIRSMRWHTQKAGVL